MYFFQEVDKDNSTFEFVILLIISSCAVVISK